MSDMSIAAQALREQILRAEAMLFELLKSYSVSPTLDVDGGFLGVRRQDEQCKVVLIRRRGSNDDIKKYLSECTLDDMLLYAESVPQLIHQARAIGETKIESVEKATYTLEQTLNQIEWAEEEG